MIFRKYSLLYFSLWYYRYYPSDVRSSPKKQIFQIWFFTIFIAFIFFEWNNSKYYISLINLLISFFWCTFKWASLYIIYKALSCSGCSHSYNSKWLLYSLSQFFSINNNIAFKFLKNTFHRFLTIFKGIELHFLRKNCFNLYKVCWFLLFHNYLNINMKH